jgi:predicted DNA-binding transcriptional regulator AlpA
MLTLDTEEIAGLLGVSRKHVTDRIVTRPDFPKPVICLSQRVRKWAEHEVLDYFRAGPRSAPATRGSTRPRAGEDRGGH